VDRSTLAALLLGTIAVTGCGVFDDELAPLPGTRIPVREAAAEPVMDPAAAAPLLELGPATPLDEWTQNNAVASRAPGHIAGPRGLTQQWAVDVGTGSNDDGQLTSGPVVANGRVFALDAAAGVTAVDAASGNVVWRTSLAPEGERAADGFGGGLAVMDGRLFATTGFGEVLALGVNDGGILWRQSVAAPARSSPAVDRGVVVVVTRDNSAFGFDAETGALDWTLPGTSAGTPGTLAGASPAISQGVAVLPFMSGELVAVSAASGRILWADALAGGRRGLARAAIADVAGDPVISGVGIFAANLSGQMVAIDGRTGRRGWLRTLGATNPVWPVGASLFVVDDDARLMRLAAATGETIWVTQMTAYEDDSRRRAVAYGGPVVADGTVYVTSSEGELLLFDHATGVETRRVPLPGDASTGPVIAGGALYVLTDDATLVAFR
jgi:outer membrane protein assembly factor BamB